MAFWVSLVSSKFPSGWLIRFFWFFTLSQIAKCSYIEGKSKKKYFCFLFIFSLVFFFFLHCFDISFLFASFICLKFVFSVAQNAHGQSNRGFFHQYNFQKELIDHSDFWHKNRKIMAMAAIFSFLWSDMPNISGICKESLRIYQNSFVLPERFICCSKA